MPTVIATGQLTLLDLNDAFVAGTQPSNPVEGMLWVDTSTTPSKLKIYKSGVWVPQTLSLVDLDPDYGAQKGKIDDLIDDAKLSHTERGDLATILYELIPVLPATGTALASAGTSADTAAELFSGATWQAGLIYQVRKAALDVGLLASNASFVATKTKYNALVTQLNLMKTASAPIIYGWETATTYKATFVPATNGDAFRTALKELYQALNTLATLTTNFVNNEAIYKDSYRSQLVGNAYGDTGTNRNFSNFTFSSTEKVTGKGSFYRSQTSVTVADEMIPVDPSRNYVLRIQTKGSTSAGKHVVGLLCYNASGTLLGERYIVRDSANSYFLAYTTSWTAYRGRIGGLGGGTDVSSTMFPVGTATVRIYFSTNLYTTTNTAYFADIEFDVEKVESGVDYNGVNLSGTSGVTVESAKNTLTMNATKGIEIIKKTDPTNPVFKLDSNTGDLNVTGNINMKSGTISWADVGAPSPAQVGAATPGDVSSAVNNIVIGGTNLLQNSTFNFGDWSINPGYGVVVAPEADKPTSNIFKFDYQNTTVSGVPLFADSRFYLNPKAGDSITFSIDFYADDFSANGPKGNITTFRRFANPTGGSYVYSVASLTASDYGVGTVNGVWQRGSYTITFNSSNAVAGWYCFGMYMQNQSDVRLSFKMRELQVELGNKATTWTPAPEDTKTTIDGVKVGGRNLLTNSGMFQNLKGWFNAGTLTTKDGYPVIYSTGTGYISTGNLQILEPNTEYVCTMEIMLAANFNANQVVPNHIYVKRVSDNVDLHGGLTLLGGNRTLVANKWEKVSVAFKTNNTTDPMYFKFHDYTSATSVDKWLRSVKLEKGNKPTDWSPAPEDASAEVNALRTAAAASGLVTIVDKDTVQTGKVKADYIDVKGLTVNNGSKNTFVVDATGNVSIDGNINMTGGSISWANVGSPSAAQVGAATPGDVSAAVGNVKVGGRNLLTDSGRLVSTSAYGMTVYPLTKTLANGTQVTVSMKATLGAGKRYFGLYNSGGNVQVAQLAAADLGADGVYRKTFNWNVGASSNVNLTIYHMDSTTTATSTIEWVKLEEGNKSTDWTPAPEDMSIEVNAFRTAAASSGLVTVVDKNTIQTGRLKADYMDVKGLTVNNGAVDTFKVDSGGNVAINGTITVNSSSNVYTKQDVQNVAINSNNVGIGMKMNYSSFSGAATNRIYFHGFSYNDTSKSFVAADVNPYFYSYDNTTRITATRGALDVSAGTPLVPGYLMYDSQYAKFYFIRFEVSNGSWYRYNAADSARHNQTFTFTNTMYIIGDVDLGS